MSAPANALRQALRALRQRLGAPFRARLRRQRGFWIVLGFGCSAVVAVLGNIVATIVEKAFGLASPERAPFTVALFLVCLGVWFIATRKEAAPEDPPAVVAERRPSPPPSLHTLRAPTADFTGREAEIDALVAELTEPGAAAVISSLHGGGGVGKTELALVVAQRLTAGYPDAQLLFDLQPGSVPLEPEALLARAIHAFQPAAQLPDTLEELQPLYCAALQGKKGLLLLDNAAGAVQVRPLLPPPAGWAVLVTSRHRFALPGASLHHLDVLPEPEACALLRRLLASVRCQATDHEIQRLARLCACLPLALRLAAGYLAAAGDWTLAEYLAALEKDRLAHLATEEESVAAVLGLSVGRLEREDPALARRWRELAVFPAPFDRAAAAAVWNAAEGEARASLSALHAQSLVDHDQASATYSLHDLLRECALQPGADGAPPPAQDLALRLRHARHYLALGAAAEDLFEQGGEQVVEGLRRFDGAWPHLEAAWAWLSAQGDGASARWLRKLPGAMPHVLDLRLPPRQRLPILESALAAARRLGDRAAEGTHLGYLGLAYARLGEVRRAVELYEQQLAIARELGARRVEGVALGNLGLPTRAWGRCAARWSSTSRRWRSIARLATGRGRPSRAGTSASPTSDSATWPAPPP